MNRSFAIAAALLLALPLAACNRGGEEPEEATETDSNVMFVPDTTIQRDLNARLDIDPRLDVEDVQLTSHVEEAEVTLVGQVPSRYELGIAMEVARSTPGVRQVWLDSVRVLSENVPVPADTASTTE